jgi:hypothetical protein
MNPLASLKKNGNTIMNAIANGVSTRDQRPPIIRGASGMSRRTASRHSFS